MRRALILMFVALITLGGHPAQAGEGDQILIGDDVLLYEHAIDVTDMTIGLQRGEGFPLTVTGVVRRGKESPCSLSPFASVPCIVKLQVFQRDSSGSYRHERLGRGFIAPASRYVHETRIRFDVDESPRHIHLEGRLPLPDFSGEWSPSPGEAYLIVQVFAELNTRRGRPHSILVGSLDIPITVY